MSEEPSSDAAVPEEVSAWLADLAEAEGLTEQELIERLVAGDGVGASFAATGELAELVDRVAELEAAVGELDDALDDQIQDVRERVIQVKRETDAKAPTEHEHEDVEDRLARVDEHVEALGNDFVDITASVDRVEEELGALDDRTSRGFTNYEEVLEYLVDATDDLERKVGTVARVVMELRATIGKLDESATNRAAVDRLLETAATNGVTSAKCGDCRESVDLGLLTAPECPHCDSEFVHLEPKRGLFRSSVLRTGRRPALEGAVEGAEEEAPDLESIVESEAAPAPAVRPDASEPDEDQGTGPAGPAAGNPAEVLDVEEVSGIGSAYAERLREAGVETVGQLARAEPAGLAAETQVPPARVGDWVERASELVEGE